MIINRNTAVNFYGQRPALAEYIPAAGGPPTLGAAGKELAQIFIPGSVGATLIGTTVDKLADLAGKGISKAFPAIGTVLYFITDVIGWAAKLVETYITAMVKGVVAYLPQDAAQGVLDYYKDNKADLVLDAFKDCMVALYRRVDSTGSQVADIKDGRDSLLGLALGEVLSLLGIDKNADRFANAIYKKAIELGAKDWQAGAAVGYGVLMGLPSPGIPAGATLKTPMGNISLGSGGNIGKAILSVPEEATKWLSKLAPSPKLDAKWIDTEFTKQTGGKGGTGNLESTSASSFILPAVALLGVVLLMRGGKKGAA